MQSMQQKQESSDRTRSDLCVYRAGDGWEVSGYYRRDEDDQWHAFLMSLDGTPAMTHLKVQDPALAGVAHPLLEVLP